MIFTQEMWEEYAEATGSAMSFEDLQKWPPVYIYAKAANVLHWKLEQVQAQNAELVEALQKIADGKYSGYVLTSMPIQDPAVVYAKAAIAKATGGK